jgi:hypothetical protein
MDTLAATLAAGEKDALLFLWGWCIKYTYACVHTGYMYVCVCV